MIALGCDFAGFPLKKIIMEYLDKNGFQYKDYGTYDDKEGEYPVFALKAANAVKDGVCDRGIIICGTGIGISIAANKVKGIRCACCTEPYSALMSREHNDANMLAMGSRVVGGELAKMIVDVWLKGEFTGGPHVKRLDMIAQIENRTLSDKRARFKFQNVIRCRQYEEAVLIAFGAASVWLIPPTITGVLLYLTPSRIAPISIKSLADL